MATLSKRFFDLLLMLAMAASLSFTVCGGFYVDPQLQYNLALVIGIPLLYLLVFFIGTKGRVATVACGLFALAATVVALIVADSLSPEAAMFEDIETNPCIMIVIYAVTTCIVFLLGRTMPGSIVLFVAGSITVGYVQFIYLWSYTVTAVLFVGSCLAYLMYRFYLQNAAKQAGGQASYVSAFATSVLTSCIITALGIGIFMVIDNTFELPAMELKLFTEDKALDEEEMHGIANFTSLNNESVTSSNTDDTVQNSSSSDVSDDPDAEGGDGSGQSEVIVSEGSMLSYTKEALDETFEVISYGLSLGWRIFWASLLVLLLVAPPIVKVLLRRRWLNKTLGMEPEVQVVRFYDFFLKRLARIGLGRPDAVTPLDFAENADEALRLFEDKANDCLAKDAAGEGKRQTQDAPVTFLGLTETYYRCAYGKKMPDRGETRAFKAFYDGFYTSCKAYLGKVKYAWHFYRL